MNTTYSILIEGLTNPKKFVEEWSKVYEYKYEEKYTSNIWKSLDDDTSFLNLFEWKNGTGDNIYEGKMRRVKDFISKRIELRNLRNKFDWNEFEILIDPHKGSVIWKIFLLHLIDPNEFPIYDQHVYRSFRFLTKGEIVERPTNDKEYYEIYKTEYLPWFNQLKNEYGLEPRKMDKSFFSFGQILKKIGRIGRNSIPKTIKQVKL